MYNLQSGPHKLVGGSTSVHNLKVVPFEKEDLVRRPFHLAAWMIAGRPMPCVVVHLHHNLSAIVVVLKC